MGEAERLDAVAKWYDPRTDFDRHTRRRIAELIELYRHGRSLLEAGCGTGAMTRHLSGEILAIDGSGSCIRECQKQEWPEGVSFQEVMIEEFFAGNRLFDDVVMAGLLEHVIDPVPLLKKALTWTKRVGRLHVSVPNALSLHRRLGVSMGMLDDPTSMTERDVAMGHRRIYTPSHLFLDLRSAGWRILHWEGVLLKPLASSQMNDWSDTLIAGLMDVGRSLPEWCAELYCVCGRE